MLNWGTLLRLPLAGIGTWYRSQVPAHTGNMYSQHRIPAWMLSYHQTSLPCRLDPLDRPTKPSSGHHYPFVQECNPDAGFLSLFRRLNRSKFGSSVLLAWLVKPGSERSSSPRLLTERLKGPDAGHLAWISCHDFMIP